MSKFGIAAFGRYVPEKVPAHHDEDEVTMAYEAAVNIGLRKELIESCSVVGFGVTDKKSQMHHAINALALPATCRSFITEPGIASLIETIRQLQATKESSGIAIETDKKIGACAVVVSDQADAYTAQVLAIQSFANRFSVRLETRYEQTHLYIPTMKKAIDEFLTINPYWNEEISHVVFDMPNKRLPLKLAQEVGFRHDQLRSGLGGANPFFGLCHVLEQASVGQLVLVASFGVNVNLMLVKVVQQREERVS